MMWFSKPAKIILAVGLVAILGTCGPQKTGGGAPAGGGTPVNTGGGGGLSAVLAAHNSFRAAHCTAPLRWSNALAATAQAWAQQCSFSHSGNGYGENIAWGTAGAFTPTRFVENWYSEAPAYDYSTGSGRGGAVTGHFTQIVWAGSTEVGCGWARCGGSDYLVCNYSPPGNYVGQHSGNVRPRC